MLSRVDAEDRLEFQPAGTFLFRKSESRSGYSLSLKWVSGPGYGRGGEERRGEGFAGRWPTA